LLYPSHYEWHKNFEFLADVLDRASRELDVPLALTLTAQEDDPLAAGKLQRAFQSMRSKTSFIGGVPRESLRRLYEDHDILLFPSLVEAFGLPLVEAMTTGMPIVASDRPWAREVCNSAALYADPHSASNWVKAIAQVTRSGLRSNPEGLVRALHFDWEHSAEQYVHVLLGDVEAEETRAF
jgi:glycosyltransferase involved in cell wall biosynthesis